MEINKQYKIKAAIEAAIADANTRGVTIEVVPSYGNGVNKTTEKTNQEGGTE